MDDAAVVEFGLEGGATVAVRGIEDRSFVGEDRSGWSVRVECLSEDDCCIDGSCSVECFSGDYVAGAIFHDADECRVDPILADCLAVLIMSRSQSRSRRG
jgi:hypothetical protein